MKPKYLIIFSVLVFASCRSLNHQPRPDTLEESFVYLDKMFDDTTKYHFKTLPEFFTEVQFHFSLGMYVRNEWGLWQGSNLQDYFVERGITHPEAMSGVILGSYREYLNGRFINLQTYLESNNEDTLHTDSAYFEFIRKEQEKVLTFFPIGTKVRLNGRSKERTFWGSNYTYFDEIAIVSQHLDERKFKVVILELKNPVDIEAEHQVGDTITTYITSAILIPPTP